MKTLREMQDNMKCNNIRIPEGEQEEQGIDNPV